MAQKRWKGLGTTIKGVTRRLGIRHCAPCARRAAALDRAVPRFWPEQGLPGYLAEAARKYGKRQRR